MFFERILFAFIKQISTVDHPHHPCRASHRIMKETWKLLGTHHISPALETCFGLFLGVTIMVRQIKTNDYPCPYS